MSILTEEEVEEILKKINNDEINWEDIITEVEKMRQKKA